jgi:biopolymer transport protein ExbD
MRFLIHKRRQPPAVIIVALIDILIVLLIFLMVTTTFKQQPALKLALPESSQALKEGVTETPPIIVSIAADGSIFLGAERTPVTIERLRGELASRVTKSPGVKLALSADKSAPFGQIVRILDAAKEAGMKQGDVTAFMKAQPKS